LALLALRLGACSVVVDGHADPLPASCGQRERRQ
jgi:hypothetical protein